MKPMDERTKEFLLTVKISSRKPLCSAISIDLTVGSMALKTCSRWQKKSSMWK